MVDKDTAITYGGDSAGTYGGEFAGTYGPQADRRYRLRIRRGDRSTVIDAILSVSLDLTHTGVSSCQCTVPRVSGLSDFRFGTAELFYADTVLFRGRLVEWPGPGTGETGRLGIVGPADALKKISLNVSISGETATTVLRRLWREDTPFEATVIAPSSSVTLGSGSEPFTAKGTALEVLQKIHTQAGMRFTVQFQNETATVESYVPEENPRTQSWDALDYDSQARGQDYANTVVVYGGLDSSGSRITETAKDQSEIDALATETNDGIVLARIDDKSLTTSTDATARAEAELADRLTNDELSGSLEITPDIVLPGYYYDIPEFAEDGTTPQLPVESVGISEGTDEAAVTLDVNTPDGPIDLLAQLNRGQVELNQDVTTSSDGSSTNVTVVEDHEGSTTVTDYYSGTTANSTIASDSSLEGAQLLDVGDTFDGLGYDGTDVTTRGNQYQFRLYQKAGSDLAWVMVGVQSASSPVDNCYAIRVDIASGDLELQKRSTTNGNSILASTSVSITDATEYRPLLEYGTTGTTNNLTVRLLDTSGTELASVSATDDEHTGGTFGWYSGAGAGIKGDYITEEAL